MTNEMKWKGIVIGILVLNFLAISATFFTLKTQPVSKEFSVKQQIHLECQKLAATTNNEGWNYKSCVESIMNADNVEAKILKTI